MNAKQLQSFLISLIPIAILLFIYFYSPISSDNARTNPEETPVSFPDEDIVSFESRLANQDDFPIETLAEPVAELRNEIKAEGSGDTTVQSGQEVRVHYRGWLASDGSIFDQSFNRGDAGFTFTAGTGAVIEGWQQGVLGMRIGEVRRLFIPAAQAYGEVERPGIPSNSDLIFDVELIEII